MEELFGGGEIDFSVFDAEMIAMNEQASSSEEAEAQDGESFTPGIDHIFSVTRLVQGPCCSEDEKRKNGGPHG